MSDDPWRPDLSPERMPKGWRFSSLHRNPIGVQMNVTWTAYVKNSRDASDYRDGHGPTPAAALADAIRKAREASDDNR